MQPGCCPAASCILANSRWSSHGLSWAGGCGFAGHAVNPSMGACRKHPCFLQSRKPAPADPRRCVGGHGRSTAVSIIFMRFRTRWRSVPSFGNRRYRSGQSGAPPRRATPCVDALRIRTRLSIGGGRRAAPVGTVKNMDVFAKPPWVKAHCLRGTASRATERTAAGGWAGARRAVYGVSRKGLPVGLPGTEQPKRCSKRKPCSQRLEAISASISSALRANPAVRT